jgi:hypothetical protein
VTNTTRQTCACGHHKSTHHREVESSGDVTQERRLVYVACLANFCDCGLYRQEKNDES